MRILVGLLLALSSMLPAVAAAPSRFPSRTVTIVVPYPPGGGVDTLARAIGERLSNMWGKPVIVENRPGASTFIGTRAVVNAAADGHTLLMTTDATITSNPHFFTKIPYSPTKDLAPISQVAAFDLVLLAHPTLAVSSLDELLRKGDGKDPVPYASYGNGSQSHVFFAALERSRKLNLLHVPYGGIAPSLRAVVAGEVMLSLAGSGSAQSFILDGRLKPLAIARSARHPLLPDVPTFKEAGIGDLDPTPWFGLFGPAELPLALRTKIHQDVAKILAEKTFDEKYLQARGYVSLATGPEQFARDIAKEMDFRGKQIGLSGVKLQE